MDNFVDFVGIYFVTREYGGPEEGGWWYDRYVHQASFPVGMHESWASEVIGLAEAFCNKLNEGRPALSSVNSEGEYVVRVEEVEGEWHTTHRPQYE